VVIADAAALGVVSAFSAPAQQAMIPSLVEEDEVPTAVALNSMTFNLARAVGPATAALAVEYLGIPAAFGLNALSYLIFVGALLLIGPRPQELAERPAGGHVRASIDLLRRRPQLVVFLVIVAAVGFASDPVNTLAPAWAHAFDRKDTLGGYIVGVFGAGAVTAAFVVAGRVGGSRRRMFATLLLLGGGMVAFALTPWLALALPLLFVAGFGYLASNTHATSRLQLGVDPWERGRVMALWTVAFLGLRPFASLLDGAIAGAYACASPPWCWRCPRSAARRGSRRGPAREARARRERSCRPPEAYLTGSDVANAASCSRPRDGAVASTKTGTARPPAKEVEM
jgi:hypothetical protein